MIVAQHKLLRQVIAIARAQQSQPERVRNGCIGWNKGVVGPVNDLLAAVYKVRILTPDPVIARRDAFFQSCGIFIDVPELAFKPGRKLVGERLGRSGSF